MTREKFHHCHDHRGRRSVFVNGNKISRVIWADEENGVVLFHLDPLRYCRRGVWRVYARKLRGKVTVTYDNQEVTT